MPSPQLSQIFSALADPTRRAILARLSEGEAPVKALAEPFALSGPAITKHLKVLEHAGLISRSREGQLRPCRLEPQGLEPAADWIDQYRAMWEAQFDRLDAYLKTVVPKARPAPAPKDVRTPARPALRAGGEAQAKPARAAARTPSKSSRKAAEKTTKNAASEASRKSSKTTARKSTTGRGDHRVRKE